MRPLPGYSDKYCARRSIDEAETNRCSLLREPIAAVIGAWPCAFVELPPPFIPAPLPPIFLMLDGFACTLAVFGACYCPAPLPDGPLLLSMCVRMSFVYFNRLVIS